MKFNRNTSRKTGSSDFFGIGHEDGKAEIPVNGIVFCRNWRRDFLWRAPSELILVIMAEMSSALEPRGTRSWTNLKSKTDTTAVGIDNGSVSDPLPNGRSPCTHISLCHSVKW